MTEYKIFPLPSQHNPPAEGASQTTQKYACSHSCQASLRIRCSFFLKNLRFKKVSDKAVLD